MVFFTACSDYSNNTVVSNNSSQSSASSQASSSSSSQSQQGYYVIQDSNGWRLMVEGEPYYIKGVVANFIPVGEGNAYKTGLWNETDTHIKNILDHDISLMTNAGINTIRTFSNIPGEWVDYIYNTFGVRLIISHWIGGYSSGGQCVDYSIPAVRSSLLTDITNWVLEFRDSPGVLFYALGNENNYRLNGNTPAQFYSFVEEVCVSIKALDPNRCVAIANGELQYSSTIASTCQHLDIMMANVYRGQSATSLFSDVKNTLNLPFVFSEFGCDAFNMVTDAEDQTVQASYHKNQWKECYLNTYNKNAGNCIGGFVFSWRDGWWKAGDDYAQTTTAQHYIGGYTFDNSVNPNINEEWFGICYMSGLNDTNSQGVQITHPRQSYYILSNTWSINPYQKSISEIETFFATF